MIMNAKMVPHAFPVLEIITKITIAIVKMDILVNSVRTMIHVRIILVILMGFAMNCPIIVTDASVKGNDMANIVNLLMDVKFILVEIIWFVEIQQKQAILNANVTLHLAETADYVKLAKIPNYFVNVKVVLVENIVRDLAHAIPV
jgi:ABC-type polysaccharide/polyol phosphate export permease